MQSEKKLNKFSKGLGFFITFFLVSFFLYFSLTFMHRIPQDWTYLHIVLSVLLIVLTGTLIRLLLK